MGGQWWYVAVLACLVIAARETNLYAEPAPNVILILVDDQGYYDLGCYGAEEVRTPEIDRLATQGIRFTDYYAAAPICSPSRTGLLTGRYPRRCGLEAWVQRPDSRRGIPPETLTLSELLANNGYATACIGKWHLGFVSPYLPQEQGFGMYFGLHHNLDPHEVALFGDQGVPLLRGREVVKRPADPAELTRLYTDEAVTFIETHREKPFFLYLPHTMLHEPLGVSAEFRGRSNWGEYGDAIQELDFHVGRLMKTLTDLKLADNTVVIYTSDNGRGPGRDPSQPMQGRKLTTWECGIRVPAIVWGPGVEIRQGFTCDEVVHAMDWYPTLATLAGIRVPDGTVLDGRDLSSLLTGKTDQITPAGKGGSLNSEVPLRRHWEPAFEWKDLISRDDYLNAFFYHGSEGQLAAVRSGRYKLHLSPEPVLYDLQEDPGETQPVRNREALQKLRGMAIQFQEEMNAAVQR